MEMDFWVFTMTTVVLCYSQVLIVVEGDALKIKYTSPKRDLSRNH